MIALSCHCGAVVVETARRPDFIHDCNCSLCTKSGARWGYFHPDAVTVTGTTKGFRRIDKDEASAEIRLCPERGSTTHFVLTQNAVVKFGNTMMGVNMWLADEGDLTGIELRFPDGRAWDGASAFGYVREARIVGQLADGG